MPKIYIVDVDGTISDSRHRAHLLPDYDAFHDLCGEDKPHAGVLYVIQCLAKEDVVILLTGRMEKNRRQTELWCSKYDLRVDDILMRPDKNFLKSEELKLSMLDHYFGDREKALAAVTCIFEDQDKNVEAFRNAGFTVLQHTPGVG